MELRMPQTWEKRKEVASRVPLRLGFSDSEKFKGKMVKVLGSLHSMCQALAAPLSPESGISGDHCRH